MCDASWRLEMHLFRTVRGPRRPCAGTLSGTEMTSCKQAGRQPNGDGLVTCIIEPRHMWERELSVPCPGSKLESLISICRECVTAAAARQLSPTPSSEERLPFGNALALSSKKLSSMWSRSLGERTTRGITV